MRRLISLLFLLAAFENGESSVSIDSTLPKDPSHLKEWIEYHKLVGVSHFYLHSSNSDSFLSLLKPYIDSGEVSLETSPQNTSDWVFEIEPNDFIIPVKADTISAILETQEKSVSSLQIEVNLYLENPLTSSDSSSLWIEKSHKKIETPSTYKTLYRGSNPSTVLTNSQEIVIHRYIKEEPNFSDSLICRFTQALREKMNLSQVKTVDMVANFDIRELFIFPEKLKAERIDLRENFTSESITKVFFEPTQNDKVVLFNMLLEEQIVSKIPKEKLIYFLWEPWNVPSSYYELFGRVYTWNDDLVDNKKFFKIHYPSLMPMDTNLPSFEDKKLCVMVAGLDIDLDKNQIPFFLKYKDKNDDLYSERMRMVEFFETKPEGELDIYGREWKQRYYRDYKGPIPGFHSGPEKKETLKKYRFSVCFENTKNINGYVTEKIFCCFAAGCVPIYWGAKNIEKYIPKNCFVDYRDFQSKEDLYQFIKTMPKETYEQYLSNIRLFLESDQAQVFSPAYLQKIFSRALTD